MNKADVLDNSMNAEEYSLGRLQFWLDYGKHFWTAGFFIYFLPLGIIMMALKLALLVFLPYMLWHLYNAGWYKSIATLLVFVVLPYTISYFISIENTIVYFAFLYVPMFSFFLCTYVISYMIGEQLNKIKTMKRWERENEARG